MKILKINSILKHYEAAETEVKHFWGGGRKLQHVEMDFTSREQSNLNIICIF